MGDWKYTVNSLVPDGQKLPPGLYRYAAVVSYDGSDFHGFQRQKHSITVQEELEAALSYVANQGIRVAPAGRTDTGVHACYQVVHFDSPVLRSASNWIRGANTRLPETISLDWAKEMPGEFHARFTALTRTYRYIISRTQTRPSILSKGVAWVRNEIDVSAMGLGCQYLVGEHDFSCFRGSDCQSVSPFRNVKEAKVYESGNLVVFEIKANAFLLRMVRNIVGALLEIGRGKKKPEWIGWLLCEGQRGNSAATAPARGLYLVDVDYPIEYALPRDKKGPFFLSENP
jgi:tRNA pseudouridine38-40 synthase